MQRANQCGRRFCAASWIAGSSQAMTRGDGVDEAVMKLEGDAVYAVLPPLYKQRIGDKRGVFHLSPEADHRVGPMRPGRDRVQQPFLRDPRSQDTVNGPG